MEEGFRYLWRLVPPGLGCRADEPRDPDYEADWSLDDVRYAKAWMWSMWRPAGAETALRPVKHLRRWLGSDAPRELILLYIALTKARLSVNAFYQRWGNNTNYFHWQNHEWFDWMDDGNILTRLRAEMLARPALSQS